MEKTKTVTLSKPAHPKRFVRETVSFLMEEPGRVAIAEGVPLSGKTEFSLRCAYHCAARNGALLISCEESTVAVYNRFFKMFGQKATIRRNICAITICGKRTANQICALIAEFPYPVVVIDGIDLIGVDLSVLEMLARDTGVSFLATRRIAK